jgi:predicted ferric reductase
MNIASPLRAALLASVIRPGQWVGPALVVLAACAFAVVALSQPITWASSSGWIGWIAFALSLVLTARVRPIVARFGGLDHQYAWHHMLGLLAYVAILVHAVAIVWPLLAVREFGMAARWWTSGAAVLSGWTALGLLVLPMAATFYGPEDFPRWLRWHRIAGLAFVAAALHVVLVGAPVPLAWWLIALTGAAALAVRSWVYRRDAGRRYVVDRVTHPANACVEVELEPLDRALEVTPGQYVFVAFHSGERYQSCNEYHPFTVSGVHGRRLTLTIKALGDCTLEMQHLSTGLAARVEGPFGAFFDQATASTPQLWVAGGIGITPFLAQLDRLGPKVDIRMAYLFRRGEDALHMDELENAAAARDGMELYTLVSGTDLAPLWSWLDGIDVTKREIYVCGPPPLLDAVVRYLSARGVGEAHLHFERFDFR